MLAANRSWNLCFPVNRSVERTLLPGCHRFIEIVKISMLHIFHRDSTFIPLPEYIFHRSNLEIRACIIPNLPPDIVQSWKCSFKRVEPSRGRAKEMTGESLLNFAPVKREGGRSFYPNTIFKRQGNNYQDRVTPNLKILLRSSFSILSLQRQTSTR